MKDNIINFNDAKDKERNPLDKLLGTFADIMFNSMLEPISNNATKITDEKLKQVCQSFISASNEIIAIFDNDKMLEKQSKDDRVRFVAAITLFSTRVQEFGHSIMSADLQNKSRGGE